MAHELEINPVTGQASMAYSNTHGTPWHSLGVPLDGLATPQEILAAAKADFDVEITSARMVDPLTNEVIEIPEKFVTYRRRPTTITPEGVTPGDVQPLGVVGKNYTVISNRQALDFAMEVSNLSSDEAVVDTAGVMFGGSQFFAYIRLPDRVIDPEGIKDGIARGLGVVTSHDGSRALTVVNSRIRIVCNNTATAALRGQRQVSIRHTESWEQTMTEARKILGIQETLDQKFEDLALRLLGTPATFDTVRTIADSFWKFDPDTASGRQVTNHDNRLETLAELWASPKNSAGVGRNGWAAWNTVTEFLDHHSGGKADTRAARSLFSTNMANRKMAAADLILA